MERLRQDPYAASLALVLGDVAKRASTGRLFLAGAAGDAGGGMLFHKGMLIGLRPPAPDPPVDLTRADVSTARRAVMMAVEQASSRPTPPFFTAAGLNQGIVPPPARLTAGDLALDVARMVEDAAWLEDRLGTARGARPAKCEPPPAAPAAALGPHDSFLLSRADGSLDITAIVALVPLSRLDALRALFGLQAAGLLKAEPPAPAGLSDLERFLERTAARGVGVPGSSRSGARPPTAPSKTAAQAPPTPWSAPEQQERDALGERCKGLAGLDHYAILGVDRAASEAIIRSAYYKLARLYHPDRLHKPHLEDMHADLETMFASITDSYNTLSGAATRAEYDQELYAAAGGRRRESNDRGATARDAYLRGRKAVEAGQIFEATRLFEVAVENDPSRAEHFHHLGACQGQNPKWRKRAEESLLMAIRLNPSSVASYVELARVYRKGGLERRCLEMYEQALRWDPTHREALAEINAAREAAGGGKPGILGGLFRKE